MFMSGACSGCASSDYTLQQGILQLLQHYIPEIKNIQKIEDPNSTVDPYFT
jgi:Fe-S cluster biogenesis protein NfuA